MAKHSEMLVVEPGMWVQHIPTVANLSRYELEDLETAIHLRRVELMAEALRKSGFRVRIEGPECADGYKAQFRYLCIYSPDDTQGGEWLTLAEARKLLDTVANLPPAEAFARMLSKLAPMETAPYTRDQAICDIRAERAQLRRDWDNGQITSGELAEGWKHARTFLDLVEK